MVQKCRFKYLAGDVATAAVSRHGAPGEDQAAGDNAGSKRQ